MQLKKLKKIFDASALFRALSSRGMLNWLPDKPYIKTAFKSIIGRKLDLKNPKTFNEKLQWLKLYDRCPEYTTYVDKYSVRQYIADTIGEKYLIPLLGVWENPDDIDFANLPDQFVLKCTHNSGLGMCICEDKSKLDMNTIKKNLRKGLKQNYYLTSREWPYKNVKRRIIAEKYIVDESGYELKDYKIFCFHGHPKLIQVTFNHHSTINLYDCDWNYLPLSWSYQTDPSHLIDKPNRLADMLQLAEKLSGDYSFARIDFYSVIDHIYFGEITFYPTSGLGQFKPEEWDRTLGDWIMLPNR